jgi:hypothetical protein
LSPLCEVGKAPLTDDLFTFLVGSSPVQRSTLTWGDCPIALHIRRDGGEYPLIAMNFAYHPGPRSDYGQVARLVVVRIENVSAVVTLLEDISARAKRPRLHVVGGASRTIANCGWDELVLDHRVRSLLKDDFESFFAREAWFRENKLPLRRGYLLHGPPGNGKSSVVRAMLSSRALTAYTMRLFDARQDDSDLDHLFETAIQNRPSMVLLEDIDRAFPTTGETKSQISLQQLLNCLDGVGSGEGIVVVATANEPAILDPAILRRPGRFDRVVHFPNPSAELRYQYLQRLGPSLAVRNFQKAVEDTEGFSFAQLREVHVIAGQRAFGRKSEIGEGDLLMGIHTLRQSMGSASRKETAAGFCGRQED